MNTLRWNIIGAALTTLLSPALAWIFGQLFGNVGLVGGAMLGMAIGATTTTLGNVRAFGLSAFPHPKRVPTVFFSAVRRVFGLAS